MERASGPGYLLTSIASPAVDLIISKKKEKITQGYSILFSLHYLERLASYDCAYCSSSQMFLAFDVHAQNNSE